MTFFFETDIVDPDCAGDEPIEFIGLLPPHPDHSTL